MARTLSLQLVTANHILFAVKKKNQTKHVSDCECPFHRGRGFMNFAILDQKIERFSRVELKLYQLFFLFFFFNRLLKVCR